MTVCMPGCKRKKGKIRNRYNPVPHLTQDTTWESNKNTRKHHIQERQEFTLFPAGDHKAAINRQDSMTDTKHKQQKGSTKNHRLGTVSKTLFTGGLETQNKPSEIERTYNIRKTWFYSIFSLFMRTNGMCNDSQAP